MSNSKLEDFEKRRSFIRRYQNKHEAQGELIGMKNEQDRLMARKRQIEKDLLVITNRLKVLDARIMKHRKSRNYD